MFSLFQIKHNFFMHIYIFCLLKQIYKQKQNRMFRAIPTNNKLCFDRDLKRSWRIHADKVKSIKSTLRQTKQPQYPFLDQRAKKIALEEVRFIQIQKENNSLLKRIKEINQKSCTASASKSLERKRTLNEPFRKRELVKVVEENQELMKRIQCKKSMYNVKQWEKDRQKIQKNITLLSEFKYKDYPNTQTSVNLWMTSEDFNKKSRVRNMSFQKQKIKPTLTYSGTKKIGESYYLVSAFTDKKVFHVELENLQNSQQKYKMEMEEDEALRLIKNNYKGVLENMIERISVNGEEGCCYLQEAEDNQ